MRQELRRLQLVLEDREVQSPVAVVVQRLLRQVQLVQEVLVETVEKLPVLLMLVQVWEPHLEKHLVQCLIKELGLLVWL